MKKYSIIYADPPWNFKSYDDKTSLRSVKHKYKTMKTQNICDLDVSKIAERDCILFIWGTWPRLPDCLETIKAWGFKYKTVGFLWVKINKKALSTFMGGGYWTRSNTEYCLIATKGHPKRINKSIRQLVFARIREHSRKPDCVRERIVGLVGDLPRVELFATEDVEGWESVGLNVNGKTVESFLEGGIYGS